MLKTKLWFDVHIAVQLIQGRLLFGQISVFGNLLVRVGYVKVVEVIFNFLSISPAAGQSASRKILSDNITGLAAGKGQRRQKLAAVEYYHCLFTLEHSLKANAIMACIYSEEGCSLCASRALVSLSRRHILMWLLLTDYMIRLVRCRVGSCVVTEHPKRMLFFIRFTVFITE